MLCNTVDCITEEENRITYIWTFVRQCIPSWNIALITTIESNYRHQLLNTLPISKGASRTTVRDRENKDRNTQGRKVAREGEREGKRERTQRKNEEVGKRERNRNSCQLVGDSSRMHYEASMWIFRPQLNSHFPAEKWCVASVDAKPRQLRRLCICCLFSIHVCATGIYVNLKCVCIRLSGCTFIFAGIFIHVPSYTCGRIPGRYEETDACAWT